jgi:hypothetical protein
VYKKRASKRERERERARDVSEASFSFMDSRFSKVILANHHTSCARIQREREREREREPYLHIVADERQIIT